MKNLAVLFIAFFFCAKLNAQKGSEPQPPPPRVVDFTTTAQGNGYKFTPIPPPLQQIAGAPKAYWSYYWEFGDGCFSFEETPLHVYEKEGTYNPILEATAHYDDGPPPNERIAGIIVNQTGSNPGGLLTVFDSTRLPIRMKASRPARANEAMVVILSYRNLGQIRTDGRLHVFFNERKFPSSHFALDSARLHFNEIVDAAVSQVLPTDVPPTNGWTLLNLPSHTGTSTSLSGDSPPSTILDNFLNTARGKYREEKIWRFTDLQPSEKRNVFVALQGTDKMLQDTNAFIHVEAIFAPFDPMVAPERFELEFEIVSSHDPNAIIVSDSRVNYRLIGSKKLDYKVQFQNNGEGPATTVELKIEIPEGLDMKRMRPLEWYPKCPICPKSPTNKSCLDTASTQEGLMFTFRNIYLPGSRQDDVNDRDSTKGFVRYRIEAERGMPKRAFRSRAKIVFDKNAPIYTNYTKTRFKIGKSPGLKVGYGFEPNFGASGTSTGGENEDFVQDGYAFLGLSLSPYKSWRVYPQIELLTGIKGQTARPEMQTGFQIDTFPFNPGATESIIVRTTTTTTQTSAGFISVEVPLQLRKNFNRFFGAGVGGSCRVIFENGKTINQMRVRLDSIQLFPQPPTTTTISDMLLPPEETPQRATRIRYTAFGDLTFGSVRKGLNLGLRAGAILGRKQKMRPFAQVSLELKL